MSSYYGQPILKEPIWTWEIPCYFFAGGLGGASAALAYAAELQGNEVLASRSRATSLVALGLSPAFLISDLGRPARFLNMFRMFKVTSPMSVGSWLLGAAGAATALGTIGIRPKLTRSAAALLGLPVSTYTAALIADTAIPAWHEARRTLPFMFAAGAAMSAGAAGVALTPVKDAAPARRLALAAAFAEVAAGDVMERRLGEHGEPYSDGAAARYKRISRACITAGSALLARRAAQSRPAAIASGVLLGAGALAARWSVFEAGRQSAADPKYVVRPQRAAIERGERRGAAVAAT